MTLSEVYKHMHETRDLHIEERRRAREYQSRIAELEEERQRIIDVVKDNAQRYNLGSVGRVALQNCLLEILEK